MRHKPSKKILSRINLKDNQKFAKALILLVISMVILSFAAVPIYNIFCKATGFGGTTMRSISSPTKIGSRVITVYFDSNVSPSLPWRFIPKQRSVTVKAGQNSLVFYEAENLSAKDIIGTAIYNVTPAKFGKYFVKIHCFCFEEQLLTAGKKMLMPVSFFLDPDFEDDPYMDDVQEITLSYSFFKIREQKPELWTR